MSKLVTQLQRTLKELLVQKNIGVCELAKKIDTSRFVVHKWLTTSKDMRLDSVLKLVDFFNCSIEYLCGKTEVYLSYKPKDVPEFVDRLKTVLAECGKTSYKLFKDTKITGTQLHQWRYYHSPMLNNVEVIANYLGVTIDYLIGRDRRD